MKVLTNENKQLEIDNLPDEIDDIRFCVLDYNNEEEADHYFKPLIFLESFNDESYEFQIGKTKIALPKSWSILCQGREGWDLELIEFTKINQRPFKIFTYNPINGFVPYFFDIELKNIFNDVKWFFPKLKYGQLLTVPLDNSPKPSCIYITHQKNNKVPEILDMTKFL